jgi:predicted nuclease of predicted toxin-antitoxin system
LIRALLDQGLPLSAAGLLREAGWDAVHVSAIGMSRSSDARILELARAENRVVITLDADFHRLLALSGDSAPSVVRVRVEGLTARPLAALLTDAVGRAQSALAAGAMVTVTAASLRVRTLPIQPAMRAT